MAPTEAPALHVNPEWLCRYCGHRESMPADAAERHRHLRLRLMQLTRARESVEAPLRTFRSLETTWPIAIAFTTLMGAWQAWTFLGVGGGRHVGSGFFAIVPLAVAAGMLSGWLGMRHTFAVRLRPLLRARPPLQPGLAARCRGCGGDLPAVRAPEVICNFCGASNVLDAALTADASALLAKEAAEYQQRLRPWASDPAVYLAPSRAFYLYGGIGAALALVAGVAVLALVTTLV